jgi:hypothetical protein
MDGAMKVDMFDLLATGEWGWERGEKLSAETWLTEDGWDFMALGVGQIPPAYWMTS